MTPLEIRPLENAGAEVLGCDLGSLTVGDANQLEAAFGAFGLLVFRDQAITTDEFIGAVKLWGAPVPNLSVQGGDTNSIVEVISTVSSLGESWHAGDSYREVPSLGSAVLMRSSSSPHETLFASTSAAFAALSGPTQRALEGLRAVHEATYETGKESNRQRAVHPIVIRHPISGNETLYVNPAHTIRVEGMAEGPSLELLNQLFEHGQRDEFIAHLDWEPGSLVMWDSRAFWTLDRHQPLETPRFERLTIAGTKLTAAVRQDPRDLTRVERAGATLAGGIITAAMMGIAEVLEPDRAKPDIEIVSEAPDREPLDDDFNFGELPPLD